MRLAAAGGLVLFASPAFAACTSPDPTPTITSTGDSVMMGDQAYTIAPSNGLYFHDSIPGGASSAAITNGVLVNSAGTGIEIVGQYDVCYDGLASGSIVSGSAGMSILLTEGDVLLGIAHSITAGGIGINVVHNGDGIVDITADDIDGLFAGISVTRNDDGDLPDTGNDTKIAVTGTVTTDGRGILIDADTAGDIDISANAIDAGDAGILVTRAVGADGDTTITANGAIGSSSAPGIGVFTDADGDVTIDAKDDIASTDAGIAVKHTAASGDISISTAAGSEISAHGSLTGMTIYVPGFDDPMPVGIYVDRSGADPGARIDIDNNADISADGMGIYVDVCSCAESIIDVQSTGDIAVDDGTGTPAYFGAGIYVSQGNKGDTTVNQTGSVKVAWGVGVVVDQYDDGDVSAGATGGVAATDVGLSVYHEGDGKITASAGGTYTITDGSGVDVSHNGNGNVIVASSANFDVLDTGIIVEHFGTTGDVTVTTSAGSSISAHGGTSPSFLIPGSTGIYVDRANLGPGTGSGDVTITNGANINVDAVGIYASLCGCVDGDLSITSTGTIETTGPVGIGVLAQHYGEGTATIDASGKITADIGIALEKAGDGNVSVTAGEIAASVMGIDVVTVDASNTVIHANGKIAAGDVGILAAAQGTGNIGISTAADIDATHGAIIVEHAATMGDVEVTSAAGTAFTATSPGSLGISITRYDAFSSPSATGNVTVTNGAHITADMTGIDVLSLVTGAVTVTSTGKLDVANGNGIAIDAQSSAITVTAGAIEAANGNGVNAITGGHNLSVTANGEINAGTGIKAVSGSTIAVAVNAKITASERGVDASAIGALGITTAADIVAHIAAIEASASGNVTIDTAAGKTLTADSGTDTFAYDSFVPLTGAAGIAINRTGPFTHAIAITSRSNIEANGVGIFIEGCATCAGTLDIDVIGNIVAPYGIIAGDNDAVDLDISGTITADGGVLIGGTTIDALVRTGASVTVHGALTGRYGLKLDGTSDMTVAGTIDVPGADALLFTGGDATLTLLPGFVINGQVDALDTATNRLIFGGTTGTASFDLDRLGTTITDFDSFLKTGSSSWTFSGANFTGLLTANAGTVVINSNIPGLDLVLENTYFHGNAGLKSLSITGGTLAPGNSIGTITVAGDATIGAGTVYGVEVNAAGASDTLSAGGTVSIDPAASVLATMEPGSYGLVTQYTIITGTTAVAGAFSGVTSVSAFYDAALSYDANHAYLTLTRNALTLGDFALTPNQKSTAKALDGGGKAVPYFGELFVLPGDAVPGALDALSGDGYASLAAAALDNGRFVRDAALDRRGARGVWSAPYGGVSHLPGDGNGPAVDTATGGLLLGADGNVGDGYLGILLGYGQSRYDIPSRDMTATSGEFSLGAYGGADWDGFYASFGAAITGRDIDATRQVVFPGVSDTFSAQYASLTAQAFTELGFRLDIGGTSVTPFGGIAGLHSATSGYTETGTGAGALTVDPGMASALVATLGVRLEHEFALNDEMALTLRGSAAWRHSMGKASTANSMAGTDAFTVAGTPLAADTLTVSAGTAITAGQVSLGLDYTGSFGSGGISNAARATLAGQF